MALVPDWGRRICRRLDRIDDNITHLDRKLDRLMDQDAALTAAVTGLTTAVTAEIGDITTLLQGSSSTGDPAVADAITKLTNLTQKINDEDALIKAQQGAAPASGTPIAPPPSDGSTTPNGTGTSTPVSTAGDVGLGTAGATNTVPEGVPTTPAAPTAPNAPTLDSAGSGDAVVVQADGTTTSGTVTPQLEPLQPGATTA